MPPVVDQLVLLVVDDGLSARLSALLLTRSPPLRVESVLATGLVEACATRRVDLVILDADVDDSAGQRLLAEVQAFSVPPQAIILFGDANDPRRSSGWDLADSDTVELFGATCSRGATAAGGVLISACR